MNKLASVAKAITALALPLLTPLAVDAVASLEVWLLGVITAVVTAIGVWAVPNKA